MTQLFCLAVLIGASPASLVETRRTGEQEIRAEASIDAAEIRLSGEVRLRLVVTGPGPLEVTRPKPLLATTGAWRVREEGLPLREILPDRRQRWTLDYRLSPLAPGDSTTISLAPLMVQSGPPTEVQIAWSKSIVVKVTTTITKPNVDDLRPVTGIEVVPELSVNPVSHVRWWWLASSGLLAALLVAADQRRRRSRDTTEIHDAAWAERQLAGASDPDRLVAILRQFLEHRWSRSFASLTSAELAQKLRQIPECPAGEVESVEAFLGLCDTARFSGTASDSTVSRERLREIISTASPAA